jgi:hypothetical protein
MLSLLLYEVSQSSTLLPSLNRRDERSGSHGRKSTGKVRGVLFKEHVFLEKYAILLLKIHNIFV